MRLLCSYAGGPGHAEPVLAIGAAALAAGHHVAVVCGPSRVEELAARGFAVLPWERPPRPPRSRQPLLPVDPAREARDLAERFGGPLLLAKERIVQEALDRWPADVVLADEIDFGALLAAERRALPYASVVVLAAGTMLRPVEDLAPLARHLVLVPVPPSFRDPHAPLPRTARHLRPAVLDAPPPEADPFRRPPDRSRPAVYATLGTEFNVESGDLFERLLAGLGPLDVDVLVTTGADLDPAAIGPAPSNVRVERYVPQADVLPFADAVVCHAGSGTLVASLALGRPLVLLPMGADQPPNAERAATLGVARVLDVATARPADIASAVLEVLAVPSYAAAAQDLRRECLALPGPDHAVELLAALAGEAPS